MAGAGFRGWRRALCVLADVAAALAEVGTGPSLPLSRSLTSLLASLPVRAVVRDLRMPLLFVFASSGEFDADAAGAGAAGPLRRMGLVDPLGALACCPSGLPDGSLDGLPGETLLFARVTAHETCRSCASSISSVCMASKLHWVVGAAEKK